MGAFNSKNYRFADITVSMFGQTLTGFRGIKYKKSQEKEHLYAQGDEPVGVQRGNKAYEGELMMLKSDFDALNIAAKTAGYEDVVDLPGFPLIVSYSNNTKITTDTLLNVEFKEFEDGMVQGDKFKEISLPIIFTKIKKV